MISFAPLLPLILICTHLAGGYEHIDFIIAAKNYKNKEDKLSDLIKKLIEPELEISRTLERIQFKNEKYDYFQSNIIFRKFDESK